MDFVKKDFSTAIGIAAAFLMIVIAISFSGSGKSFIDIPSVLIVLGGTFAITLAGFSFSEFLRVPSVVLGNIFRHHYEPRESALIMLGLADTARRKGILAVQSEVAEYSDIPFLSKGLAMVVDGVEAEEVERVLRQQMHATRERHQQGALILRRMSEVSPAMGLIGTLIGLVQMLGSLSDPSSIGPAMSLALLTTLYGAMLAYMLFSPLASKLERNSGEEALINTLYLRGLVSISKQENPRRLEMLLNTILPPASRVQYFD